jgi:hypothetical protein
MRFDTYEERRKSIKKIIFWSVLVGGLLALFFMPTIVGTQAQTSTEPINLCDSDFGGTCLEGIENTETGPTGIFNFILNVVYVLIYLSAAVAVFFAVLGGVKMITSGGAEGTYKEGLETFKNAIIGLIVAIVSLTVVNLIVGIIPGLNIFG